MENFKPSETGELSSSGDGSKFMESLKGDAGDGKSFMESLKGDTGDGKSFMESLKFTGINDSLGGSEHPETHVPFVEKEITNEKGEVEKHSFPVFDSKFDCQLPENLYKDTDKAQFEECNKQLKEAVKNDPELAKQFTPKQLDQIENGLKPTGYTWHHNEEKGKMQLVDTQTHQTTAHLGGRAIWGGGGKYRKEGGSNE